MFSTANGQSGRSSATEPYTLFRILCSPARVRNVAVLERNFAEFFDDFSAASRKAEVIQVIREVIHDPACSSLADDDDSTADDTAEYLIFNKLRTDGWFIEVRNGWAEEVHTPREAHALLSTLVGLGEELKVDISAEASLIDSGILAAYDAPTNKVMNSASARRQAVQLRRAIDGVLTSLFRIEQDLMQSEDLSDLLERFMESFVEKLLLQDYRSLKASAYNPMRFQRSIIDITERFINDEGLIARAATALADQGLAQDLQSATAQIRGDLVHVRALSQSPGTYRVPDKTAGKIAAMPKITKRLVDALGPTNASASSGMTKLRASACASIQPANWSTSSSAARRAVS